MNYSVLKNKLILFLDAIKLGNTNLFSKHLRSNTLDNKADKRVWVRSGKDNLEKNNSQFPNLIVKNSEVTNLTKKDIIDENKN